MPRCDHCTEPATISYVMGTGDAVQSKHLCYVHAAEAAMIDVPIEKVQVVSRELIYPVNAIVFLLEALHRAPRLESAKDVCSAVLKSAKERFGNSSRSVLTAWRIVDRPDIGRIVLAIAREGIFKLSEQVDPADFEESFPIKDALDGE